MNLSEMFNQQHEQDYWNDANEKIKILSDGLRKILKHENKRFKIGIGYDNTVNELAKNTLDNAKQEKVI